MNAVAPTRWRSRTTFVLALSASVIGLGNLWRFSYLVAENGGAPFVVAYVCCLFLLAVPILVAELTLGAHGRAAPVSALRNASDRSLLVRAWMGIGVLACVAGLCLLVLNVIVAGWGMAYIGFMYDGTFSAASPAEVGDHFARFVNTNGPQLVWQTAFLLLVGAVVVLGVRRGLGVLAWFCLPAMLAMLGFLVKFALDYGDLTATREYLLTAKWVDFSSRSVLVAMGQAFFSLGIGLGVGLCFGAYSPDRVPVLRSVLAVAVLDTVFSLLAGLAILAIVFANNIEAASGPTLLFVSAPYAFGNIALGEQFGAGFFLFLVLASFGSAVALMEPAVAALVEGLRMRRFTATVIVIGLVWLATFTIVSALDPDMEIAWFGNQNLLLVFDRFAADVLVPLVSLATAIFVGWRMRPEILQRVLGRESAGLFWVWRLLLRFFAPAAIVLLLLALPRLGV